jgi:hypothetical protein
MKIKIFLAGFLMAIGAGSFVNAAPTDDARVKIWMDTLGTLQAIQDYYGSSARDMVAPGMQSAISNIYLLARPEAGVEVFAELYNSSRYHKGTIYDYQGWVRVSQLRDNPLALNDWLLKHANFRAGHFEIDFGTIHHYRTDNGNAGRNPLVGNWLVDMISDEAGVELAGKPGDLRWMLGSGMANSSESFAGGKGFSLYGKIEYVPQGNPLNFNMSLSAYRADNSDAVSTVNVPLGYQNRGGSRYLNVIERALGMDGQAVFGAGGDVTAYQLDGMLDLLGMTFSGSSGYYTDADQNLKSSSTNPDNEVWLYFGGEVKRQLNSALHVAFRGQQASCSKFNGVDLSANIRRIQIGAGYWLSPNLLIKTEYVTQWYNGFTSPAHITWQNAANFSGVLVEVFTPIVFFDNVND